jgi:hypothetical protein
MLARVELILRPAFMDVKQNTSTVVCKIEVDSFNDVHIL